MKTCVVKRRFYSSESIAGGAVTINTYPGFGTPKACMVYYVENNASPDSFDSTTAQRTVGIGFAGPLGDGTSTIQSRCMFNTMIDAFASTGTTARRRQNRVDNRILYTNNTLGVVSWQATAPVFTADALTINLTASTPFAPLDCIFTFFTGNDLTVGVGDSSYPNTNGGTRAYSLLNFQPDIVFIASAISPPGTGVTDDIRFTFGAATGNPAVQKGVYFHSEFTGSTVDCATLSSSNIISTYATATNSSFTQTISAITTGGWTFTSNGAAIASNTSYIYLALQSNPAHYTLNDFVSWTGTGVSFAGAGQSFVPRVVLGATTNGTTDNTMAITAPTSEGFTLFAGDRSADTLYFDGIGTIQTNSSGTLVTGSGTQFLRLLSGDKLYQQNGVLIGTINNVGTATSIVLTSNATSTLAAGTSFVFSTPGQNSILYGVQDGATNQEVISSLSSSLWKTLQSSSGAGATLDLAFLNRFDSRPGFELNYNTNSGTSRRGFVVTFQDEVANRRRGQTS
jgi:hypothetical protein